MRSHYLYLLRTLNSDQVNLTFHNTKDQVSKKILIVEDEPMSIMVLEKILKPYQFQLIVAVDGIDAVSQFQQSAIDLVVMDLYMPKMDGFEASKQIKKLSPDTPIIVISSTVIEEHKLRDDIGIDYLLRKPLDITKFQDFIHMLLLA
jgi:CheY-like chemotaxis protein